MSGNNGVATVTALSSGRAQTGVASAASGPLGSATGSGGNDPHPLIGYVTGTQQQQHQQVWPLTQFYSFCFCQNTHVTLLWEYYFSVPSAIPLPQFWTIEASGPAEIQRNRQVCNDRQ